MARVESWLACTPCTERCGEEKEAEGSGTRPRDAGSLIPAARSIKFWFAFFT